MKVCDDEQYYSNNMDDNISPDEHAAFDVDSVINSKSLGAVHGMVHGGKYNKQNDDDSAEKGVPSPTSPLSVKSVLTNISEKVEQTLEQEFKVLDNVPSIVDVVSTTIILINAVMLGVEVETSKEEITEAQWDAIDIVFTICFSIELLVRVHYMTWRNAIRSGWCIFDFFLILFTSLSTWVFEPILQADLGWTVVFRVLRVLRLVRLVRVARLFKELWLLVIGIAAALRTLVWVGILLSMVVFTFSIFLCEFLGKPYRETHDDISKNFGTVMKSMFTCFQISTFDDWPFLIRQAGAINTGFVILYLLFLAICAVGLMNIVIGILCESMMSVVSNEKYDSEQEIKRERREALLKLRDDLVKLDVDGDEQISIDEIQVMFNTPDMMENLTKCQLSQKMVENIFTMLDLDGDGDVPINQFIDVLLKSGGRELHLLDVMQIDSYLKHMSKRSKMIGQIVNSITGRRQTIDTYDPNPRVLFDVENLISHHADEANVDLERGMPLKFDVFFGTFIVLNGIILGIQVDKTGYKNEFYPEWYVIELMFTFIFITEACLRYRRLKSAWFTDWWNLFDGFLIFLNVIDVFILKFTSAGNFRLVSVIRIFRVLRLCRLLRLFGLFRELWLLVSGLGSVAPTLFWGITLLMIFIFIFAIIAAQVIGGSELWRGDSFIEEYFGSVGKCFLTLIQISTFDDWPNIARYVMQKQPSMWIFFVFVVFIGALMIMNLIIGIICDGTLQVVTSDNFDNAQAKEADKKLARIALRQAWLDLDEDRDNLLQHDELIKKIIEDPTVKELILGSGIQPDQIYNIFQLLDIKGNDEVNLLDFVEACLRLTHESGSENSGLSSLGIITVFASIWKTRHSLLLMRANMMIIDHWRDWIENEEPEEKMMLQDRYNQQFDSDVLDIYEDENDAVPFAPPISKAGL